jgi:hypothetical protein
VHKIPAAVNIRIALEREYVLSHKNAWFLLDSSPPISTLQMADYNGQQGSQQHPGSIAQSAQSQMMPRFMNQGYPPRQVPMVSG